MNFDDSQEQDCTVYIQQLKSDNPSLKLNAASKISVIAAVLGHNRIRDELIPYLVEIIEQMDNDNDFLIRVAQGLLELKGFCKNNEEISIIIYPLRILASLDQPAVRDQAIASLKELAQTQDQEFYEKYYFALIKTLNNKNGPYAPRVTACSLIPETYPHVNAKSQEYLRELFKNLALQENSPLVRRALAENIPAFAAAVKDKDIKKKLLLNIWQAFIVDPIDIIRIKALETAIVVARLFKKEEVPEKFLKYIKVVDTDKKSWRIRYSLIECLAEIIEKLDKEVIKKEVVELYEELLKDTEAEVRAFALIQCPKIAKCLSKQHSFTVFFQYFDKASKDGGKESPPTVKLGLVEAIVGYFESIQPENVADKGINIVTSLVKDENFSVRINIIKKFHELHLLLGKDNTFKYLLPLIEACFADKKWRVKLAIAENIVSLLKVLQYDEYKDFIQKIFTTFFKDHNNAVREETTRCLVQLKDIFGGEIMYELAEKYIRSLVNENNYIYRITANKTLKECTKVLSKKELNDLFLEISKKMESEKVSNVMIAYLAAYAAMKGYLNAQSKKEGQDMLRRIKKDFTDEDVLYFVDKVDE